MATPKSMAAVRFHGYGGPEVLRVEALPVPDPGPGEVRVKVRAVGVNFVDTMRRRGVYFQPSPLPYLPGVEVAGTVDAVGPGVTAPAVGTAVFGASADGGGYAEFAVLPAEAAIPVPPGVDPAVAASILVQGLTARLALTESAKLAAGEAVLVHAAGGGVGSLAVQMAKGLGAGTVVATASTAEKRDLALSLGADAVVDYTRPGWPDRVKEATGGRGVDVILESVGGDVAAGNFDCLAPFGRVVVFGAAGGTPMAADPGRLLINCQAVVGLNIGLFFTKPEVIGPAIGGLIGDVAAGRLKVTVGHTLPLDRAAEAHRLMEGRQTTGKVVLEPRAVD